MPDIVLSDGSSSPFDPERLRRSLSERVEPQLLDAVVTRVTQKLPSLGEDRVEVSKLGAEVGEALLEVNGELPAKEPDLSVSDDPIRAARAARVNRGLLSSLGIELPAMPSSTRRQEFYGGLREALAEAGVLVLDPDTLADAEGEEGDGEEDGEGNELKQFDEEPLEQGELISTVTTVSASLRGVSWLWDTTVPNNPFGTDGPKQVPKAWPGDKLTKCRQWHGIDISCDVKDGAFVRDSLQVSTPSFIGVTSVCGILGKAHLTDRKVTAATWGTDERGDYVEVTALLGSRLGAFIPDLDVGVPSVLNRLGALGEIVKVTGVGLIFLAVQHIIEEFIEQVSEEGYLGENSAVAKIYSRIGIRLYTTGRTYSGFESSTGGNGFQTTKEIIDGDIGYSFMPEHHAYLNGKYHLGVTPKSSDGYPETVKWIDSWRPYDVMAFFVLAQALQDWCKKTPLAEKKKVAAAFAKAHPKVYVGTTF